MTPTFSEYMSTALERMCGPDEDNRTKFGNFITNLMDRNKAGELLGWSIILPPAFLYACAAKTRDGLKAVGSGIASIAKSAWYHTKGIATVLFVAFILFPGAVFQTIGEKIADTVRKAFAKKEEQATNNYEAQTSDEPEQDVTQVRATESAPEANTSESENDMDAEPTPATEETATPSV